jgi:hypothetical protein
MVAFSVAGLVMGVWVGLWIGGRFDVFHRPINLFKRTDSSASAEKPANRTRG